MVISLPRSQVEMTSGTPVQERITKVVRRVASNLIANDEAEIADVVRRRLFEELARNRRAQRGGAYADWCFQNRASCRPNGRPSTRRRARWRCASICASVSSAPIPSIRPRSRSFTASGRAWRSSRPRAARWRCWRSGSPWLSRRIYLPAQRAPHQLGSAPLHAAEFRGVVLGQLGESRLLLAIDADIAGSTAHARALDVDTKDALRDIHRAWFGYLL